MKLVRSPFLTCFVSKVRYGMLGNGGVHRQRMLRMHVILVRQSFMIVRWLDGCLPMHEVLFDMCQVLRAIVQMHWTRSIDIMMLPNRDEFGLGDSCIVRTDR